MREPHTQINTTAWRVKGCSTPPVETTHTSPNHHAVHNRSTEEHKIRVFCGPWAAALRLWRQPTHLRTITQCITEEHNIRVFCGPRAAALRLWRQPTHLRTITQRITEAQKTQHSCLLWPLLCVDVTPPRPNLSSLSQPSSKM